MRCVTDRLELVDRMSVDECGVDSIEMLTAERLRRSGLTLYPRSCVGWASLVSLASMNFPLDLCNTSEEAYAG